MVSIGIVIIILAIWPYYQQWHMTSDRQKYVKIAEKLQDLEQHFPDLSNAKESSRYGYSSFCTII